MPAIYGIKNTVSGKMYVGKTTNVKRRFTRHKTLLKNNKHWNQHLQRSYNKNGINCFEYVILEMCEERELAETEQKWIDAYKPNIFNQELFVADKKNNKNSFYGKKHTVETKEKMSQAKKGLYEGCKNPNYGKIWSNEKRQKMCGSKNHQSKLNEEQVRNIILLLKEGLKHQVIAEKYNISRTVVTRINSGARWSHLKGEA